MCPRIRALQCGLGPGRAKAQLNVSGLDQANSLLPMTAEHKKGWAGSDTVGTVEVEIISIDEALAGEESHGDLFVKLDVQGYELEALKGAQRSMPRVAALLVEASLTQLYEGAPRFAQLWEFIEGHGLRCWAIPDLIYAPGGELPMQANVVFVRPRSGGRRS
jgi:FkbM family methyltransferase